MGGDLVTSRAKPGQIVPVDSEHSAIAQALRAGAPEEVRRLVLTASGGPFRGRDRASLADVTPAEALAHPTWNMGRVVTTNSATLVNKGLEVIEAHLLFDVPLDRIDVVVHPQSIVHSMVEFVDGSTIAQASPPDMRLPISLGLDWPNRVGGVGRPLDWTKASSWDFEPLDEEAFPAVRLAKRVGRARGTYPAVFNAANEQAVDAFHDGRAAVPRHRRDRRARRRGARGATRPHPRLPRRGGVAGPGPPQTARSRRVVGREPWARNCSPTARRVRARVLPAGSGQPRHSRDGSESGVESGG